MKKQKHAPTMADVAQAAGVALGTVSKVVNHQPVGEPYRQKVLEAIERLGYQYNSTGRILRTEKTDTVALIIPNTVNPYFARLVHHINIELEKKNRRMLLCFTEYDRSREADYLRLAQQNWVDGVIALTYNPTLTIPDDVPCVTIDRFFSASVPCVASDNFGGGRLAARKLHELGCRRVTLMRIGSTLINEPSKRRDGFLSGCAETGLQADALVIPDTAPFSAFSDYLRAHFHGGKLDFDGIFAGTDSQAWQLIRVLRDMGLRVPEDVQVIGFDGIQMFGDQEYIVSTIVQPVQQIAETCVGALLSPYLSTMPSLICLPVSYAYGGTTKA